MTASERRTSQRCPVCQGPALEDEAMPEGIRCRVSTCAHNHSNIICPRCSRSDLEAVSYEKGHYRYTCRECTNVWEEKD